MDNQPAVAKRPYGTVWQTSTLLLLPRELRDMILELVLVQPHELKLFVEHFNRDFTTDRTPPSLMHACHQLRNEAAEIWYGKNTIRIHSVEQLLGLLDCGAEHHQYLKRVRLFDSATPYNGHATSKAASADRACDLAPGTVSVIASNNHPKLAQWTCSFVNALGRMEEYENDRFYAELDEHYWATQDER